MIAEALSRAAGGQVTIPARQLINEILQVEPNEPRALFLWGLAAYQDEAYQLAIDRWAYLYQLSAPNAPWRERLKTASGKPQMMAVCRHLTFQRRRSQHLTR